ncbi:hypothetical protein AVEN_68617-1 [Araneus ventricosus]|uniref:Uncharacterized protein n=1 Tax=Araneus ventricosus TaxID=182803 RepID=A0A4Y2V4A9_ARAVE|nr:hypothetical protein AVEN_68617-1 [Araneus ventricosus]
MQKHFNHLCETNSGTPHEQSQETEHSLDDTFKDLFENSETHQEMTPTFLDTQGMFSWVIDGSASTPMNWNSQIETERIWVCWNLIGAIFLFNSLSAC